MQVVDKKGIGNGNPMQKVNYQISLYPPHENRKIERRVRKRSAEKQELWKERQVAQIR